MKRYTSHRSPRQAEKSISMVCDPVGDSPASAGSGAVFEAGADGRGIEPESGADQRHCCSAENAARKTQAVCQLRSDEKRMQYEQPRAVEMTGYRKRGKPKAGFHFPACC